MAIALKEARPVLGEEIVVERPDGLKRIVAPHPIPLFDGEGKVAGALNMLIDITDQKRATQALVEKNKDLEQFAYVASHDLQEPLNTITSFICLLENELPTNPEFIEYLGYIKESSNRLTSLITDLLEHSRIGRNSKLQKVNFNKAVEEVLADMRTAIESKKASIKVGILPELNVYPSEIRLLFQNLISNAIKFQQEGAVPEVNITAQKDGNAAWHFTIEDNGIGIEEKYKERVFVIFQRLHTSKEYEGTGIGLAHCKKIIDLHKGRLWMDSQFGKGSKFHFTISELV
jgi:light-regulated signal transduction histidine kinase (bacteriophytochrome)